MRSTSLRDEGAQMLFYQPFPRADNCIPPISPAPLGKPVCLILFIYFPPSLMFIGNDFYLIHFLKRTSAHRAFARVVLALHAKDGALSTFFSNFAYQVVRKHLQILPIALAFNRK